MFHESLAARTGNAFLMTANEQQKLSQLLDRLNRDGSVAVREFACFSMEPVQLGLKVDNDRVLAPPKSALFNVDRIQSALSPHASNWMRDLRVLTVTDSTNTRMAQAARSEPIAGLCWFAELQTLGRGRRGRAWLSAYARNVMVSMGFAIDGSPADSGALSLAVGLAAADLVEGLGAPGVAVKWPNDVLISGAKVCGILIELVAERQRTECVVGIGLNLDLGDSIRAGIDQPVADLRQYGINPDRNALAARLVSNVVAFVEQYQRTGFGAMREAYDQVHACQGRLCRVVQGNSSHEGIVAGVSDRGELRLRTADGERYVNGGEVSLRLQETAALSPPDCLPDAGEAPSDSTGHA